MLLEIEKNTSIEVLGFKKEIKIKIIVDLYKGIKHGTNIFVVPKCYFNIVESSVEFEPNELQLIVFEYCVKNNINLFEEIE